MKEVSCQVAFPIIFRDMKKRRVSPEILCEGIPYSLDHLRNEKENVEWDVFCKIMSNTRSVYNDDDDYVELGVRLIEWKVVPVLSSMIGFFLNPMQLYRLLTDTRRGMGTQHFRCITTTTKEFNKHHLEILLELHAGYQYCKEFFLITKGVFIACPSLLKLKNSNVIMHETNRGALYDITIPFRSSPFAWLRQLLSLPSSKKAAINELNKAYELLYDRYNQLEESRVQIQKQAKQLETAYSISQLIRSDLDLDFTLSAVAESLVKVAGFAAVEINIHFAMDSEPVQRTVRLGDVLVMTTQLKRELEAHGKSIGEINLWLTSGSLTDDAHHLLDYIVPTITMEIMNALSFTLINDYRNKLEHKVDEIQAAIIDERRRISSEIHDDLGTNLSAIALMSGVMKEKISGASVEKISKAAQQSLEKISEIVWSLNPRNDKLENLLAYIRKYTVEYFELTSIKCKVNIPNEIPDIIIKGEQRRDIFLSVKEALHNVLKHADASFVQLAFLSNKDHGEIIIHDNGKGIATDHTNSFGNGLRNMKERMRSAGGYFEIENNKGTIIHLGFGFSQA